MDEISNLATSQVVVDLKILFGAALKCGASAIIVSHNHPSGTTEPSEQDRHLTKRIVDAGNLLGITILDHQIMSPYNGYYSFSDHGEL